MPKTYVLAGDVGGTRARFAIFEVDTSASKKSKKASEPEIVHQDSLSSRAYKTFEAALADFIKVGEEAIAFPKKPKPIKFAAATFGIAGPVVNQRVKTTNLPFTIDARTIQKKFGIPTVTLLNDLVAVGLGAIASPPSNVALIHRARPAIAGGTLAVIAAGTGLGEAMFVWDGTEHIACPTEGSHVDFAPRNTIEDELLSMLREEYGRVSYERIASGSTIAMIYRFFVEEQKVRESKEARDAVARAEDPNVAVVELAEAGRSEAATRAIELWSSVYGAEAGNLALKSLSMAGVFVCGGVSVRLRSILTRGLPKRKTRRSPFIEAFLDKGRMRALLDEIPVGLCLEPRAGLLGAATHALSQVTK